MHAQLDAFKNLTLGTKYIDIFYCLDGNLILSDYFRLAEVNGANPRLQRVENFEILSLIGTLSQKGLHVHISVADATGKTYGGHLLDECEVYYYVELIIAKIENVKYTRIWNEAPLDSEDEGSFHVVAQDDASKVVGKL